MSKAVAGGLIALGLAAGGCIASARQAAWPLVVGEFDLVALPALYWVALIAGTAAGLWALWHAETEGAISLSLVGIAFLYGPAFLLGLYPAIAGWDSFLHTGPAQSLLQGAGLPPANLYAGQYPGPPLLLATLAGVTGLPPVDAGLLIAVGLAISLVLIWTSIARFFLSLKASAWTALAILALTPTVLTNEHFSPWLLAYAATWGIVLLLATAIHAPAGPWTAISTGALLLGGAVVVSHPFLPIVILGLVLGCAGWSAWIRSDKTPALAWFLTVLAVVLVSWFLYVATTYLATGLSFIRDLLRETQDVSESWAALPFQEVFNRADLPALALILLRIGLYLGIGGLALTGLLRREQRRDSLVLIGLVATTLSSVVVGFSSDSSWLLRVLYLAPPLLTVAAAVALTGWAGHRRPDPRRQIPGVVALGIGLVAGLVLWHPPTLVYSVNPSVAAFVIWPQETAATAYVAATVPPTTTVGSDLQTLIVYSYFQPNYRPFAHGLSMGGNLPQRAAEDPLLFDGPWLIRSRRQDLMSYQAQDLQPAFWAALDARLAAAAERVYDNGFTAVYRRR